jgi:cell division septation protein DedD
MIGNADGVLIPTQFIKTGKDVFAFLYHVGEDYGKTVYTFCIPNRIRPDRTNEQPEPEQQSVIDQTIAALNTAVAKTAQDVIDADASAQSAAESAENAAQSASQAAGSATNAEASKQAAAQSDANAASSAGTANSAATSAGQSAASAATSADRAEQAAAQSGYLWFYIENGKLYMDRTANTQVDFFMRDGKLYVEEIA